MEKQLTTGVTIEGYSISSCDEAVKLVRKAHPTMPHFRLVSWDIAINAEGMPLLIEANLCIGGIDLLQLNNGPLLEDDTKEFSMKCLAGCKTTVSTCCTKPLCRGRMLHFIKKEILK